MAKRKKKKRATPPTPSVLGAQLKLVHVALLLVAMVGGGGGIMIGRSGARTNTALATIRGDLETKSVQIQAIADQQKVIYDGLIIQVEAIVGSLAGDLESLEETAELLTKISEVTSESRDDLRTRIDRLLEQYPALDPNLSADEGC